MTCWSSGYGIRRLLYVVIHVWSTGAPELNAGTAHAYSFTGLDMRDKILLRQPRLRNESRSRGRNKSKKRLHQPALVHCRADEGGEQRVRLERPRLELGVELHADEPGMILVLDHLGQQAVGRHSGEAHAMLLEPPAVAGVDLVAVAMALGNLDC